MRTLVHSCVCACIHPKKTDVEFECNRNVKRTGNSCNNSLETAGDGALRGREEPAPALKHCTQRSVEIPTRRYFRLPQSLWLQNLSQVLEGTALTGLPLRVCLHLLRHTFSVCAS